MKRTAVLAMVPAMALAVALAVAVACGTKAASVPVDAAADSGAVRMRGTLRSRDSSLFLVACGTTEERAVTALPASQLVEALAAVVGAARDSMYVEFVADTTGSRLVVREALFASTHGEGPRCDRARYPYDVEALGNEPFWRVTIDGDQLVLQRADAPLEQVFTAGAPVTTGALTTFTAHRDEGQVRELTIGVSRDACRDGMSDAWYPYRAEVRFGSMALHGCARR